MANWPSLISMITVNTVFHFIASHWKHRHNCYLGCWCVFPWWVSSSSDSISLRGHNRQPAHCHHHIHYQSSNPSPYPSITIISITITTIISKASADTLSHQNANFNIHYIIPVIFFIVPIGKFVPGPCATSKVLVYIFVTNASGAIWWPNLHPILKWDIVWLNLRLMR